MLQLNYALINYSMAKKKHITTVTLVLNKRLGVMKSGTRVKEKDVIYSI